MSHSCWAPREEEGAASSSVALFASALGEGAPESLASPWHWSRAHPGSRFWSPGSWSTWGSPWHSGSLPPGRSSAPKYPGRQSWHFSCFAWKAKPKGQCEGWEKGRGKKRKDEVRGEGVRRKWFHYFNKYYCVLLLCQTLSRRPGDENRTARSKLMS